MSDTLPPFLAKYKLSPDDLTAFLAWRKSINDESAGRRKRIVEIEAERDAARARLADVEAQLAAASESDPVADPAAPAGDDAPDPALSLAIARLLAHVPTVNPAEAEALLLDVAELRDGGLYVDGERLDPSNAADVLPPELLSAPVGIGGGGGGRAARPIVRPAPEPMSPIEQELAAAGLVRGTGDNWIKVPKKEAK